MLTIYFKKLSVFHLIVCHIGDRRARMQPPSFSLCSSIPWQGPRLLAHQKVSSWFLNMYFLFSRQYLDYNGLIDETSVLTVLTFNVIQLAIETNHLLPWVMLIVDGCEGDCSAEWNGHMRICPGFQIELCFVDVWSRWKPLQMLNNLFIFRTQLQLLASACLLLASKLHDPRPMSLLNLVVFTDCSISVPELQSMEMLVLEKLRYVASWSTAIFWVYSCQIIWGKAGWKNARGCEKLFLGGW